MPWNPEQYAKFAAQRDAPFDDLLPYITCRDGLRVIDLGCGSGELTRRLADALPNSHVLGIDTSAEMLTKAKSYERDGLRFRQGSIDEVGGEWDVIFSHAALQWLSDHPMLIPRLMGIVKAGGQFVAQIPANHQSFPHRSLRETAAEEPFVSALGGWQRESPVLLAEEYGELLYQSGGRDLMIMDKLYPHVLPDVDAIIEWLSGTGLIPYMERLPAHLHEPFRAAFRQKLAAHYGEGEIFYGFRRTLLVADKI